MLKANKQKYIKPFSPNNGDSLFHRIFLESYMNIKKSFQRSLKFGKEVAMVEKRICPLCADIVDEDEFRTEVFIREFESSGLCQGCQDVVFG